MISNNDIGTELAEGIERYRKEANQLFYDLNKQLLLLGTITVTLSPSVAFSATAFPIIVTHPWVYLAAIGFGVTSVGLGVWQLYRDWAIFKDLTKAMGFKKAHVEGEVLAPEERQFVNKFANSDSSKIVNTGNKITYGQMASLTLAFLLIFATICQVIYYNRGSRNGCSASFGTDCEYVAGSSAK